MIVPAKPSQVGAFRLKRGAKASSLSALTVDDIPALSAIDGPFQLAEYLALKIRADPHDVAGLVEVPAEGRSTDRDVWIYEHLRRLPIDLTPLVSQLLSHCTKESCPEMKADQWQYLCVAHGSGVSEECSAIDYILHTLDSATAILNSTKNFPSRMSIPPGSLSHFPSLSRRLSRIFSHAYFHHREQFLISESETSLYARFVALCEAYGLVGKELLIIPNLGKAEEASEDEEDDEAGDMEEEDEADEAGRAREKEKGASKRTLSLDRQSGVGVKVLSREKGKGKVTEAEVDKEAAKPEAAETATLAPVPANGSETASAPTSLLPKAQPVPVPGADSSTSAQKVGTLGRGTKGRGKQNRGTVLWSSDSADVPSVPEVPTFTGGNDLARTESSETAVYIGEEDESPAKGEVETAPPPADVLSEEAEVTVPKDEIELLEEAGKLDAERAVSPLPPTSAPSDIPQGDGSGPSDPVESSPSTDPEDSQAASPSTTSPEKPKVSGTPSKSPSRPTISPSFSPTAATSPLNPPRSLSRSPEARQKALSAASADTASPSKGAKEQGVTMSGLPKIAKLKEGGDALDAEGSKAIIPDVPAETEEGEKAKEALSPEKAKKRKADGQAV